MLERVHPFPRVWTADDWKLSDVLSQLCGSTLFIFCVALALRLGVFFIVWHQQRMAVAGAYGYEAGSIAAAIAKGRGFSSPFPLADTGATAWLSPGYPYFVAAVFKVWGTFTPVSHIILEVANCIFSALVILPIRACAQRGFSPVVAISSSWLWAVLPFAWWIPVQYIWDTTLTTLALAVLVWATVVLGEDRSFVHWIAYGALAAISALISASIFALFPLFLLWLAFRRGRSPMLFRLPAGAFLACVLLLSPWIIRNHRVLGEWVPLRSNFGMELWIGNNPYGEDVNSFASHPVWNRSEALKFEQMGEVGYVQAKEREAVAYMRSHLAITLHSILDRIWSNWFAVTDRPHAGWAASPLYVRFLFVMNFLMIVLGAAGVFFALRDKCPMGFLYLIVVSVFPLPYYLTHTLVRYRFPIEPVLTILCASCLVHVLSRNRVAQVSTATRSATALEVLS